MWSKLIHIISSWYQSDQFFSYFFGSYYLDELIDEEEPNLVQPGVDSESCCLISNIFFFFSFSFLILNEETVAFGSLSYYHAIQALLNQGRNIAS